MLEYLKASFIVWLIGFLPLLGIYIAIPVGFFLKLDPYSIAFFSIFGTYFPIPIIILLFDHLYSYPRIKKILLRFYSERTTKVLDNHGMWFLLFVSPLLGAWTVSVSGRLLHMDAKKLALSTLAGMILYGVGLTVLIQYGLCYLHVDERILRILGM